MNRRDIIEKDPEPHSKPGIYCGHCRFRMIPSAILFEREKMVYCIPCKYAISLTTNFVVNLLSLVKREVA